MLFPGINLKSVGTVRDAQKWKKRDNRHKDHQTDIINFNLLSPFTIHKGMQGLSNLENIRKISGNNSKEFTFEGMKITSSSLRKGMHIYKIVAHKFLGNSIISRIHKNELQTNADLQKILRPTSSIGTGKWLDVSGLICPIESINNFLLEIESKKIGTLKQAQQALKNIHENYYEYEWNWASTMIEKFYKVDLKNITAKEVVSIVKKWQKSVVELDHLLYDDAKKEFSLSTQIGFGVDGESEERKQDFMSVRGDFDSNPTVVEILNHIDRKTTLGNNVIEALAKIK